MEPSGCVYEQHSTEDSTESMEAVTSESAQSHSLRTIFEVLKLHRSILGRRIYLLILLLPLSAMAESVGITLLLPLLARLDNEQPDTGGAGVVGMVMERLPLPATVLGLLLVVGLIFVLKAVLRFGVEVFLAISKARIITDLKADLIEGYSRLNYLAFTSKNTGHYINIATYQTNRVGQAFMLLSQTAMQICATVVFLGAAVLVNVQFALIAAGAGLMFVFVTKGLARFVAGLSRRTVQEQTHLNAQLVQMLHGLKYLVATDRATGMVDRVKSICGRLFRFHSGMGIAHGLMTAIKEPLSVILILVLIGIQAMFFEQSLGGIAVALLLLDRATKAMFSVQGNWQRMMELVGSAESVQEEFSFVGEHVQEVGELPAPVFSREIEFQGVSFAYDSADGNVLHDVSLKIPCNQTIAFVGPSGAGKSTIADLLTLLLTPTQGAVTIDGVSGHQLDAATWRQQIGYVCQETVVFDETAAVNICLDPEEYRTGEATQERVRRAAEQAFAADFIGSLPDGFETQVGDRGVRLSGGQRQRLFIARELYKQPRLLLLDEATSALDSESERAIQSSIDALHGQVTVVLIAHRLATIRNADYIYVLDEGRVVEEGSFEELSSSASSRFSRMVELQSL